MPSLCHRPAERTRSTGWGGQGETPRGGAGVRGGSVVVV